MPVQCEYATERGQLSCCRRLSFGVSNSWRSDWSKRPSLSLQASWRKLDRPYPPCLCTRTYPRVQCPYRLLYCNFERNQVALGVRCDKFRNICSHDQTDTNQSVCLSLGYREMDVCAWPYLNLVRIGLSRTRFPLPCACILDLCPEPWLPSIQTCSRDSVRQ